MKKIQTFESHLYQVHFISYFRSTKYTGNIRYSREMSLKRPAIFLSIIEEILSDNLGDNPWIVHENLCKLSINNNAHSSDFSKVSINRELMFTINLVRNENSYLSNERNNQSNLKLEVRNINRI